MFPDFLLWTHVLGTSPQFLQVNTVYSLKWSTKKNSKIRYSVTDPDLNKLQFPISEEYVKVFYYIGNFKHVLRKLSNEVSTLTTLAIFM